MSEATLEALIGHTVYDRDGEKIGKVRRLYLDNATGAPTWMAVSAGLFAGDALIPLIGARHQEASSSIQVSVVRGAVRTAPYLDEDGHISGEAERELLVHYGLEEGKPAPTEYRPRHARPEDPAIEAGGDEPLTYGTPDPTRREEEPS
ncbi:PRC-barrel domain-containing protein [Nocardia sp. NPDC057353]|uniref:PRC-barrel domain-containing protein n=1 Tax=Nocardia sp. NPDC057353 TaxID=3346104 RepID=UPI00363A644B